MDPIEKLERELAGMRARNLPPSLAKRIEQSLTDGSAQRLPVWPDVSLMSAMIAGAVAACVILSIALAPDSRILPSATTPIVAAPDAGNAGETPLAWGQSDPRWIEILK